MSADRAVWLRVSRIFNPLYNAVIVKYMCLCTREWHYILTIFERLETDDTILFAVFKHHLAERGFLETAQVLSDQFIENSLIVWHY